MPGSIPAAIYLPAALAERWQQRCMEFVGRRGYELVAVVVDADGGWASIQRMLEQGTVEVVVTPRHDDPPPLRVPRIEYLEDEGSAPGPERRRPRVSRRGEAAAP